MIDKSTALDTVLTRVQKLEPGHYLDVRTYKRNRCVLFVKTGEDEFLVIQDGYEQKRFPKTPYKKLRKLFKTLLKKEFPRSTKIRLYEPGEYNEAEFAKNERKIL